jgi:hypothetical protein
VRLPMPKKPWSCFTSVFPSARPDAQERIPTEPTPHFERNERNNTDSTPVSTMTTPIQKSDGSWNVYSPDGKLLAVGLTLQQVEDYEVTKCTIYDSSLGTPWLAGSLSLSNFLLLLTLACVHGQRSRSRNL